MTDMRGLFSLIAVLLIGIFLASTNPSMDDFHQYMRSSIAADAGRSLPGRVFVSLSSALKGLVGIDAIGAYTNQLLAGAHRSEYLALSVYTVDIAGQRYMWIGALKSFFLVAEFPAPHGD